jgi:hypothetical protein
VSAARREARRSTMASSVVLVTGMTVTDIVLAGEKSSSTAV